MGQQQKQKEPQLREQEQDKTTTFRDYTNTNCHNFSSLVTTPSIKNGCSSYKHISDLETETSTWCYNWHKSTRQVEDANIRAYIRDPTQANKAVDLARDLHYILINICQGAAATVVRQNRYNAHGCETLRLLHNFNPRHCTITHGQQQAHLIRHSGLFYLRAEKIDTLQGSTSTQ